MEENRSTVHRIHLFRGIMKPREEFRGMLEAETVSGIGWRLIVLSVINAVVAGSVAYYVSEVLHLISQTKIHADIPETAQGVAQGMAVGSNAFGGLISPVIVMAIMALIFWIFFSDIGYKKLFAVELYLQLIGLIGSIVAGILMVVFQSATESYLNLGAITQLFTDNLFINGFFGGVSIFLIWKLYVQITAYQHVSTRSPKSVAWILIILNVVFMLILGGMAILGHQLLDWAQQFQQMQPK